MHGRKNGVSWWTLYLPMIILLGLLDQIFRYNLSDKDQLRIGLGFLLFISVFIFSWINMNTAAIIWEDYERWKRAAQPTPIEPRQKGDVVEVRGQLQRSNRSLIAKIISWALIVAYKVTDLFHG